MIVDGWGPAKASASNVSCLSNGEGPVPQQGMPIVAHVVWDAFGPVSRPFEMFRSHFEAGSTYYRVLKDPGRRREASFSGMFLGAEGIW